ncbi:MAG: AAA family ATPase [Legionellaceae bacterium]|nr:AAA family ATPase [Legionellaceae bacterium]
MLLIFGGLPGVGKTTISKALVKRLKAVYLRIDTVEQLLKREAGLDGPEGYMVCFAQATENLKLGMTVVADSVNPIKISRDAWQKAAEDASAPFIEIELICSNLTEHQRRVETRQADIKGHQLPTWQNIQKREYEPWLSKDLVFDTSVQEVDDIVEEIVKHIESQSI